MGSKIKVTMKKGLVISLSILTSSTFTYAPVDIVLKPETHSTLKRLAADAAAYFVCTQEEVPPPQFPFKNYQELVRTLGRLQPDIKVVGIPAPILNALQHCLTVKLPTQDQLLAWVPPRLLENLYDYQKEGVAFAVAHGGRCMIADEMGVGKSRQGLAVLSTFRREWPALILCPSSLKGQWGALAEEWLRCGDDTITIRMVQKGVDPLNGDINIISYVLVVLYYLLIPLITHLGTTWQREKNKKSSNATFKSYWWMSRIT